MIDTSDRIYQTGEAVPFSGMFEVVGSNRVCSEKDREHICHFFKIDEIFFAHDGMDVCWRLVANQPQVDKTFGKFGHSLN